jgi:chromosomal replication initiator protein
VPSDAPPAELTSIWQRVREELRAGVPESTFQLWLEPLEAVSAHGSTLYLSAPDRVRDWVERRYASQLVAALDRHAPHLGAIRFVTDGARDEDLAGDSAPKSLPLDPRHTFDRFVIGPGNRFAHAAALAVAELPGEAYNPLFLHGCPGLGKSHLLGAIATYMHRHHPELTIHHTTAERFTGEFVTALRRAGPDAFKRRYRTLDALLIDDVQVLEGKARTEEEFVHTFNALYTAGKQIVLSSDRPPEALSRLAERLRDRFQWGLCVEIEPPDLRTRLAVLLRIASEARLEISEEGALRELAAAMPGNVRRLEGALTRAVALASLLNEPLNIPLVRKALGRRGDLGEARVRASEAAAPTVRAIQDAVSAVHGISRDQLLSSSRVGRVARARQLAMYLSRELTPLSLSAIAVEFSRDHTTVLHAVRAVGARLEPGSDTAGAVHRVRHLLHTNPQPQTTDGEPSS